MRKVLVVGGQGCLGSAILRRFKNANSTWKTFSFDILSNKCENSDVELSPTQGMKWESIVEWIDNKAKDEGKFDAIITAAGGFVPGDIYAPYSTFETNWKMNMRSAFLSAQLAVKYLSSNDSLFLLTGAKAAMESGPDFAIGYGLSKASTHHLAKSLKSHLTNTVCILPDILDTPGNRAAMPDALFSEWSKVDDVADKIFCWAEKPSLVQGKLFIEV